MNEPILYAFPMHPTQGMTLRDYFAAKAMQGNLSSEPVLFQRDGGMQQFADWCYLMADAMLKSRTEPKL